VKFYATPNAVLQAQLKVWDDIVARKEKENPMFRKVNDSMRTFAERTTRWQSDTNVDYRMAAAYYFGKKT